MPAVYLRLIPNFHIGLLLLHLRSHYPAKVTPSWVFIVLYERAVLKHSCLLYLIHVLILLFLTEIDIDIFLYWLCPPQLSWTPSITLTFLSLALFMVSCLHILSNSSIFIVFYLKKKIPLSDFFVLSCCFLVVSGVT
jgi:hypothetical protein